MCNSGRDGRGHNCLRSYVVTLSISTKIHLGLTVTVTLTLPMTSMSTRHHLDNKSSAIPPVRLYKYFMSLSQTLKSGFSLSLKLTLFLQLF